MSTEAKMEKLVAKKPRQWWLDEARRLHSEEGTLEVDDNAQVSPGDGGAYVQAWVWVPLDDEEEDGA